MIAKFKNVLQNRGSSLVFVIIITFLLIILGTAMVGATVLNFKVNKLSQSANKSFYINDGAIEEAIVEINEMCYLSEKSAMEKVNDTTSLNSYVNEDKWKEFLNKVNLDLVSGNLTEEEANAEIKKGYDREFEKQYYLSLFRYVGSLPLDEDDIFLKDYILLKNNEYVDDGELVLRDDIDLKSDYKIAIQNVKFKPENVQNFDSANLSNINVETIYSLEDGFVIKLKTDGTYNISNKKIELSLRLIKPNYNYVIKRKINKNEIKENVLIENSLASYGDIAVLGGKVNVKGDIYSYGTFKERNDYRYRELGGLLVGLNKAEVSQLNAFDENILNMILESSSSIGNLEVDGKIRTRSSIRIMENSSKLTAKGNVYSNYLAIDKSASNSILDFDKNLYLLEDLRIEGDDANIVIGDESDSSTGSLWTFLDGNPSGSNLRDDLSGSIVIATKSDNVKITSNRLMIAGIAYLNYYREESGSRYYYQTGESFITNNNLDYYMYILPGEKDIAKYVNYQGAILVEPIDKDGNIIKSSEFKVNHFIEYANNPNTTHTISDRDRNILNVTSVDTTDSNTISNTYKDNYSQGLVMIKGKVINPITSMIPTAFENMRKNACLEIDPEISILGNRNFLTNTNDQKRIDDFLNFSDENNVLNLDGDNFIYINNDENKNLYFNVPFSLNSTIMSLDSNAVIVNADSKYSNTTGFIATKGNIYIYSSSDFTFNGPIISNKNIVLFGNGKKTFINKTDGQIYTDELVNMIYNNSKIYSLSNSDIGRKLVINQKDGQTTRTIYGNLDISVINNDTVIVDNNSYSELLGVIRTEGVKNYKILKWKETN